GIRHHFVSLDAEPKKQVIFFHGTTRTDKEWPTEHWIALANMFGESGVKVLLPWGNDREKARAEEIASKVSNAKVLPKTPLVALAKLLAESKSAVAVDTGLGHLAAALDVP